MTWFRVDDGFPEHPKLEVLESRPLSYMASVSAWTLLGADCSRRLTDGFVSRARFSKVLHMLGKFAALGASGLVECGLWREVDGGWQFHDWHEYQPTKAVVDAKRKEKAERQRRWRSTSTGASQDMSVEIPETTAHARAIPTRPDPTRPKDNIPEVPSLDIAAQVASIDARYNIALIHEAREACALSRKRGTMTDSAWLVFLRKADAYTVSEVEDGCRTFCDKWADGDRSENYLLAIIRGNSKPKHNVPKIGMIAPGLHEDFVTDTSDLDRIIGAK